GTSEGILPGLSPGIPNLRLIVREGDLERAYEILGYTVDKGDADKSETSDGAAPKADHIQEAEPRSSRKVKPPPFVQAETEASPAESPPSATDDLGPLPALPALEAGSEGLDIGLILLLLMVGGLAVGLVVWLVLL